MTYKITDITENTVYLVDQNDVEYSEKFSEYDTLMISIGYEFEADTHRMSLKQTLIYHMTF